MKVCKKCNRSYLDDTNYCEDCGSVLESVSEKAQVKPRPKMIKAKKLGPKIGALQNSDESAKDMVMPLKKAKPITRKFADSQVGRVDDLAGDIILKQAEITPESKLAEQIEEEPKTVEAESVAAAEPIVEEPKTVEAESVAAAEPIEEEPKSVEVESVAAAEQIVKEPKSVEAESVAAAEPIIEEPKSVEAESVAAAEPIVEEPKTVEAESVAAAEPNVEDPKTVEAESVAVAEPIVKEPKSVEAESVAAAELIEEEPKSVEAESVAAAEPIVEEPKSVEAESVAAAEPIVEEPKTVEAESVSAAEQIEEEPKSVEAESVAAGEPILAEPKTVEAESVAAAEPIVKEPKSVEAESVAINESKSLEHEPVVADAVTMETTRKKKKPLIFAGLGLLFLIIVGLVLVFFEETATYIKCQDKVSFIKEGGKYYLKVDTDGDYEVVEDIDWITAEISDNRVELRCASNSNGSMRRGELILESGNISQRIEIVQKGLTTYIRLSERDLVFSSKGGTQTVMIDSDGSGLNVIGSGCEVTNRTENCFDVHVGTHSGASRTGKVTVSSDDVSTVVNFYQRGICSRCQGAGKVVCSACLGDGKSQSWFDYGSPCAACGQSGKVSCSVCGGEGEK